MNRFHEVLYAEIPNEDSTAFVLTAHGAPVSGGDLEQLGKDAIEVRIFWERALLSTHFVESEGAIVVGDHEDSIARIPETALGADALEVVRTTASGFVVRIPRGTVARVERASTDSDVEGPRDWETSRGDRIEMAFGSFRLQFVHGCAGRRVPRMTIAERLRRSATPQVLAAAFLHTALFGAFAYYKPALAGEDEASAAGRSDQIWLMREYLGAAAERERTDALPQPENAPAVSASSGGSRASGSEGKMGQEGAPIANKRWGKVGPIDNPAPALGPKGSALVQGFEMIGLVAESAQASSAPFSPWGKLDALGSDPLNANGNLWGTTIGDAGGVGGLGLTSTGEGGDGRSGWVGLNLNDLGRLGYIGPGGMARSSSCPGCRLRGHSIQGPSMRPGTTVASGHMPPEVIQRIVHDNFGRFRSCYEAGLRANPSLEGRVVTRFAIDRQGVVTMAEDGGSSLPNASVVACVVRSFYSLTFPEHDGGIVTVVYPLALLPE